MPADTPSLLVCTDNHRHRVPSHEALDTSFNFPVAGEFHLIGVVNCIDIRCIGRKRQHHPASVSAFLKVNQEFAELFGPVAVQNIFERFVPIIKLFRSNSRNRVKNSLIQHSYPQR